ncbi:MAG: hypothetical protein E7666_05455 [Ruminococcaceae bacterium]|nr:hypothetical protein [Oscillospiraceae bacterium]
MKKRFLCLLLAMLMLIMMPACRPTTTDPSDSSDTDTQEPVKLVTIAENKKVPYKIILASGINSDIADAATTLRNSFDTVVGAKPDRAYDIASEPSDSAKEILIGLTNRDESAKAMEKLGANEFIIERVGNKIVLLGANDYATIQAIHSLIALWTESEGKIEIPEELAIQKKVDAPQFNLLDGDEFAFKVIRASRLSGADSGLNDLVRDLEDLLGCNRITVSSDSAVADNRDQFEVLVGTTNREESTTAYKELTTLGYSISVVGNKIAIVGTSEDQITRGLSAFYVILKNIKNGTLVGDITISSDFNSTVSTMNNTWIASVPKLTNGILIAGYSGEGSSCILERSEGSVAAFNEYVKKLEAEGFAKGEDYTLGGNRYALRYGSKATVFASYSETKGTIRLYIEAKNSYKYPAKDQKGTVNTYEPKLWQLRVDNINSRANGGMSYVWLLSDGTFFVIDGGYNTGLEADNLVKFLSQKNPLGGKPVITGWYFSHTHSDHIGAIQAVAKNYASAIDVKAFYYHFENAIPSGFRNATAAWPNAVHYARLHTGMQVELPGVTMNVIYTLEDQYPSYPENGNDYSAVIRMDVKGQRVMFLGDIQKMASKRLLEFMGKDILKSDIVQFSHHGYEGGTLKLYTTIEAPTVLWPMNYVSTQASYGSIINVFKRWYTKSSGGEGDMANYYISHQAPYCKQIIVAGGSASQEITFPYTPKPYTNGQSGTNGRLPNLDSVYNEIYDDLIPDGYIFTKE